ncbi:DUF6113 family protein [Streptomyces sp. JJ38]|uniref:DUF6113 family protein n=1 Tax=Streptomyces sp. JJ38 TaxID=2738128 RepID=UPI001C58AC6E|nr:DUF6113 family protein [Streptomyces sp. JJ38]MBW1599659.1 hypothetical protein [Streptomyces sp. JJ38]
MSAGRLLTLGALAVVGVVVAVAGALVHTAFLPGGLLLALGGIAALCVGGSLLLRTRAGAAVPAVAWTLTVLVLLLWTRPEGDFLFGTALGSYVFLYGGMILAVICATVAPPGGSRFTGRGDPVGRPQ